MGQKVNPTIFRLGKTKQWKSKYFEKKSTEHSVYAFYDLEIKKFIYRSLEEQGLAVHNYKLYYLDNSLHIFVSYFLTVKTVSLISNINKVQKIKLVPKESNFKQSREYKKKYRNIRLKTKNYANYTGTTYNRKIKNFVGKNRFRIAKRTIRQEEQSLKFRRLRLLQYYKKYVTAKSYQNVNNIKNNSFLEKIFESLTLFTNRRFNIFLTFHQLNKNIKQTLNLQKLKVLKKSVVQLRKYKQNEFFREGINLLFISTTKKESSDLLAQFLATYLKKLKRHNFFLKFVENALKLFNKANFSNIEGIKIKVKGRLNGAPRAKHRTINIGKGIPVLTLNSNLDYSERTSFTSNGTFGVKVWIFKHANSNNQIQKIYYV